MMADTADSIRSRWPQGWLQPQWPAPAHVHAVFTTRQGGVSAAPFDSLNLGDHVQDRPEDVLANRQRLQAALQQLTPGVSVHYLRQVHGTQVHDWDGPALTSLPEADACVTTQPGRACAMLVADCVPVLLTDRAGTRVAAVHAGWRGLQAGVLESALKHFQAPVQMQPVVAAMEKDNADATEVLAWIGPCIGQEAFEVGEEVRDAFVRQEERWAEAFLPNGKPGKYQAHLALLTRWRLERAGVTACYGNDGSAEWCTATQASRFFSHRRDAARLGSTGRMAALIWIGSR